LLGLSQFYYILILDFLFYSNFNIYMTITESALSSIIRTYCEQVRCGSKLAAEIGFHKNEICFVETTISSEQCLAIYDQTRQADRVTAWIYKYPFVSNLIHELFLVDKLTTPFTIWATGKLFGYSDYEIANFLKEHGYFQQHLTVT
jgi:hypothetical protein